MTEKCRFQICCGEHVEQTVETVNIRQAYSNQQVILIIVLLLKRYAACDRFVMNQFARSHCQYTMLVMSNIDICTLFVS